MSYRYRDIAVYWLKIATPLYLAPPLGVTPSDLHNSPWLRKTRMMGLSHSERISMIRSAVLIQYTRVMDGRTDGQTELAWHIRSIAYMLSRVKMGPKTCEISFDYMPLRNLIAFDRERCVRWKKSGEKLHVSLDQFTGNFSGDYVSAVRGCWHSNFFNAQ